MRGQLPLSLSKERKPTVGAAQRDFNACFLAALAARCWPVAVEEQFTVTCYIL